MAAMQKLSSSLCPHRGLGLFAGASEFCPLLTRHLSPSLNLLRSSVGSSRGSHFSSCWLVHAQSSCLDRRGLQFGDLQQRTAATTAVQATPGTPSEKILSKEPGCLALSPDGCYIYIVTGAQLHARLVSSGAHRWAPIARDCAGPLCTTPDGATLLLAAGASNGRLKAISAGAGEEKWVCEVGNSDATIGPIEVSPDGASVFVGSSCGTVHAVDVKSGSERWKYAVGEATPTEWSFCITPDGAVVVFWAGDGMLHAVDVASGERKWASAQGESPPVSWALQASPDGSLVFFATEDGLLHAVSVASGEQRWAEPHNSADPSSFKMTPDGTRFILGTADGGLQSLAGSTGVEQWVYDLGEKTSAASVLSPDGTFAFVGDSDGQLHAVTTCAGERKWLCKYGAAKLIRCAVDRNGATVFVQTSTGDLHAFNAGSGEQRWVFLSATTLDAPLLLGHDGSQVFLQTQGGVVNSFDATSGNHVWEHQPTAQLKKDAQESTPKYQLSGSAIIRKKRYMVVAVFLIMVQLHRSGYLKRSHSENSLDLESAVGKPTADFLADVFGLQQKKPEELNSQDPGVHEV